MSRYLVRAFYKFFDFKNFKDFKDPLLKVCQEQKIKGTILLSLEGINSTIAGPSEGIESLFEYFKSEAHLVDLVDIEYKDSWSEEMPFNRMLVKVKREIVTFNDPAADPRKKVGIYVEPKQWNELIQKSDVTLIDTRNDYEIEMGTFSKAINPKTTSFTEFADYIQRHYKPETTPKVAMCCTGGIRCEKATAYLLALGYKEVYHLKGGILKYFEEVLETESLFQGECFVFDKRVSVNHRLEKGQYELCYACQHALVKEDLVSPHYKEGVSCPYCYEELDSRCLVPGRDGKDQL